MTENKQFWACFREKWVYKYGMSLNSGTQHQQCLLPQEKGRASNWRTIAADFFCMKFLRRRNFVTVLFVMDLLLSLYFQHTWATRA
jgi:hypothetical protein